jgi:hypothetical protein
METAAHKASSGQSGTDLDIDEDLEYQRRAWRFQRIGWIAIGLALIGALLGLFGKGPLSRSVATDPENRFAVEYDRIARYESPFRLVIQLQPIPESSQTARLWIDRQYAQSLRIEQITPEADRTELTADGFVYMFHMSGGQSSTITMTGTMQHVGWVQGRLGTGPRDAVVFQQFAFP